MLRKFVCAAAIVVVGLGAVMAEEFTANISKVDGNKITFKKTKKGEPPGEEQTMTVAADAKINKGKFNKDAGKFEAGEAIEGGLKSDTFTKIGEKGLNARITTDADNKNITAISIMKGGKKKNQN